MNEKILWGTRNGDEEWQEQLLSTNPAAFETVKAIASREGFGMFRISEIDLTVKPDFSKIFTK